MKTIVSMIYPLGCHRRVSFLICVIFVAVSPILVAAVERQKNEHGNTYERKPENGPDLSKNSKEVSSTGDESNDSMVKAKDEDHRNGQSTKTNDESSAALNRFLDDVLKAQNDLQWIDQVVRNGDRGKDLSKSNHRGNKLREKRAYDQIYGYENPPDASRKTNLDDDTSIKAAVDLDEADASPYGVNGKDVRPSLLYGKGTTNDRPPKDWSKTKDLCSLNDWLNSNKHPDTEQDKSGDRWAHDYEPSQRNGLDSLDFDKEASAKTDARTNVRNQRDETKKEEAPTLESLKETILELKKSLNEGGKKQRGNSKNADSAKVEAKDNGEDDQGERRTRSRNKHRKSERKDEESSAWWENSAQERLDLKKREQGPEALEEKNAHRKVWRTKRTEVNNDDGNPKLFHRAGFGEPYLEGNVLKEFHDRKRRSKGMPSDEKRQLNEAAGKNSVDSDDKNSMKISEASDCKDADTSDKKEFPSNDVQGTGVSERGDNPTNNLEDTVNSSRLSKASSRDESKNTEGGRNYDESDLSRENLNAMENKLTGNEEKGESPAGNSLRAFESMTNELRTAASSTDTSRLSTEAGEEVVGEVGMQKSEESRENVGSAKREEAIKVFDPEKDPYRNGEPAEKVRRTEAAEEGGKLSRKRAQEERSVKDSGNIDILLKSENKNLIKFSNAGPNGNGLKDERSPFTLNMFDVKKKMVMQNEDQSGKSVSAVYNVKIEKARVDTPVGREESYRGTGVPFGNGDLDFDKNKLDDGGRVNSVNELSRRNANEKQLGNSMEFDKESVPDIVNEATQNWFREAVGNRIDANTDQGGAQKCNEVDEKDKYKNEMERFNVDKDKGESAQDGNYKFDSKDEENKVGNKKKYTEIFIMPDGMDDRVINDRYGHRRILQYMEYSNDEVEDADLNYSDKEEEENQRLASAERSEVATRRKERAPVSDKKKDKVNMLIKEKLDRKKKPNRGRKRRDPSVIEYYDYDSDIEQQDHDALSSSSEQERSKNNYEGENVIEFNAGLENEQNSQTCIPPAEKRNEQEQAVLKEEREKEKLKNKEPKQEFITADRSKEKNTTSKTAKPNRSAELSTGTKLAAEEGSSRRQRSGSRLKLPIAENEDKFLDADAERMLSNPTKCLLNVGKNLNPLGSDDFFEDVQTMDDKNERINKNLKPLYEELKKIYDWNEGETKSIPRIKGIQGMYHGIKDKFGPMAELLKDRVDTPEIRGPTETSGKSEIRERPTSAISSGRHESLASSNVSRSDYFALKSTDDMFKGGPEQNNGTEAKLRGPNTIGKVAEWRTQKVSGVRNGAVPEKDAVAWSLTNQRQYIDTDSGSPYENRKYLESQFPRARERVQNIDREKRTVISSRDLHESFVEPLDWIDDFDTDIGVRLGRSLKTIETSTNAYVETSMPKRKKDVANTSIESIALADSTTSKSLVAQPSLDLQKLFGGNDRPKRELPYDSIYDDAKNEEAVNDGLRFLNSYENLGNEHRKRSNLRNDLQEYDYSEDYENDYGKVARSTDSKKGKRHGNKKKTKKRKGKSKKSKKSRRKRRHHKKHTSDSKLKNRDHDRNHKKHKKHTGKHANHRNVKKSKSSQNEGKVHDHHRESSRKGQSAKTKSTDRMNPESEALRNRISSLLAADDMEDESQMDSALQGELAGKIVEQIFDQVQKNADLKVSLGPGLYRKHKARDTLAAEKSYRQAIDDDELKHTEELLNKIMLLLNRLIFDEVQRKTCISLPPDLIQFLDWMLDVDPQDNSLKQLPTLPLVHEEEALDFPRDKFLFQTLPDQAMEEINKLYKKIRLIKNLIKEYGELAERDKEKVHSIQDFLAKELDLLLEYIEAKEEAEKKGKSYSPFGLAKGIGESIIQYQIGMSNASNGNYSKRRDTFPRLKNTPKLLTLNNLNFLTNEELFPEGGIDVSHRGNRIIRSLDKHGAPNKKQRKRKKRRRKHGKRHKGASAIDQSRHKDTGHKAAVQREKREYLDEDFWDSVDSGYEEPLIYTSMDIPDLELNGNSGAALKSEENAEDTIETDARSRKETASDELKHWADATNSGKNYEDVPKELANVRFGEKSNLNEENKHSLDEEEPITGKNRLEDEILLLNKRQAWKQENEQQLEEVAFGEDMRKAVKEKELFEELTEIDKRKNDLDKSQKKNYNTRDCSTHGRNNEIGCSLSDEEKLRMLEQRINVYADNE